MGGSGTEFPTAELQHLGHRAAHRAGEKYIAADPLAGSPGDQEHPTPAAPRNSTSLRSTIKLAGLIISCIRRHSPRIGAVTMSNSP